jgi:hypothetical protein
MGWVQSDGKGKKTHGLLLAPNKEEETAERMGKKRSPPNPSQSQPACSSYLLTYLPSQQGAACCTPHPPVGTLVRSCCRGITQISLDCRCPCRRWAVLLRAGIYRGTLCLVLCADKGDVASTFVVYLCGRVLIVLTCRRRSRLR